MRTLWMASFLCMVLGCATTKSATVDAAPPPNWPPPMELPPAVDPAITPFPSALTWLPPPLP